MRGRGNNNNNNKKSRNKMASESIVEYFGGDGGHKCGYCKSEDGFVAPGMWAHRLSVQDLQVSHSNNSIISVRVCVY